MMLNLACLRCELKESCEKVGISLHEMQKLIFLMGHESDDDPFALGMVRYTLQQRSGDFSIFQAILTQNDKIRRCWLE